MKSWEELNTTVAEINSDTLKDLLPPICYKYRVWEKSFHSDIITKQELYFSAPLTEFEDPDDCRYPVDFDFSKDTLEANYLYIAKHWDKSTLSDEQLKSLANYFYKERFSTPDKQDARKKEFYEGINHNQGIFCFCKNNIAEPMWNGYAENFKGFCVGISLRECTEEIVQAHIFGGHVTYVPDGFPFLKYLWANQQPQAYNIPQFILRLLTTKYRSWKHEDEYRLAKYFLNARSRVITKNDRLFKVPKICYKEVIFGDQMNSKSIEEIINSCSNQGLDVVYKVASLNSSGSVLIQNY